MAEITKKYNIDFSLYSRHLPKVGRLFKCLGAVTKIQEKPEVEAVLPDTSWKAYEIRGLGQKTQGFVPLWTWVVNEQTLLTSKQQKTFLFHEQLHCLGGFFILRTNTLLQMTSYNVKNNSTREAHFSYFYVGVTGSIRQKPWF